MEHITLKTDVLIVGAGPVGLLLANILKRNGIHVILIDKRINKPACPRSIAVNQATLDVFKTIGLNTVFDLGIEVENINLFYKQKYLGQLNFKDLPIEHPYFFHISQNSIEEELENTLLKLELQVLRGTELISYIQDDTSVSAQVKKNEQVFSIQSTFLIGCDGGHSKVREIMGCGINQRHYGPSFVLADVVLKNYSDTNTSYIFTNEGYVMIVPLPKEQYRLIFSIHDQSFGEKHCKNALQKLLHKRTGKKIIISTISWTTQAQYGHRISNEVYQYRVVLAGDALHQFSPIGGTNMNVGIQDAYSLGWRIIHNLLSHPDTFDFQEYATERKAVIQKQQHITEWITALITRSKKYPLNKTMATHSLKSLQECLSGFLGGQHLQCFISYREIDHVIKKIRCEFAKANYVLLTHGNLDKELVVKIKNTIKNKEIVRWIHATDTKPFVFSFCRPDARVILWGDIQQIDQWFNLINLK